MEELISASRVRLISSSLILVAAVGCGGSGGGGGAGTGGEGGSSQSTTVTFTFNGPAPTVVAAKIGSGAFSAQNLSSGTLTLTIPGGTNNFVVAYACPAQVGNTSHTELLANQFVVEASTADGDAYAGSCPTYVQPQFQMGTLTASVDGSAIPRATEVEVAAANGASYNYLGGSPVSSLSLGAPLGTDRVEVLAYSYPAAGLTLLAARNFNNQAVPGALNGGSTVVLGAADQVTTPGITYNNVPAGFTSPYTNVDFELEGTDDLAIARGAADQYPTLPASAVESGDYYLFSAVARNNNEFVLGGVTSTSGGPISFTFPAPWSYAGPAPAALPGFSFAYTGFTSKTGALDWATINWMTGSTTTTYTLNYFEMAATANYLNGATSLAFPDLSGLSGFLVAPSSGTAVNWTATIGQYSYVPFETLPPNATWTAVQNVGTYTVP